MKKFWIAALLLAGIALQNADAFSFKWKKVPMDGSRTGVEAPNADNVTEAMGSLEGKVYVAPNGTRFRKGSTPKVARLMIDAQPSMAIVKEKVGFAPKAMKKKRPESELSNMIVDVLMSATEAAVGKHVDIGITNFGGIRVDMPQGEVLEDDILSMLPFANYLCYLEIKGSDIRYLFERFAESGVQVVGGVKCAIRDHKLESLLIGGEPLDDERVYGVATIDFLLDGGDDVSIARNALSLERTDIKIYDAFDAYLRGLAAEGKPIEYHTDGRVAYL